MMKVRMALPSFPLDLPWKAASGFCSKHRLLAASKPSPEFQAKRDGRNEMRDREEKV